MISHKDIEHLKDLARVEFGEKETESLAHDLGAILDYVNLLSEADVSGAPEMARASNTTNVMRVDEATPATEQEYTDEARAIIDAFPDKKDTHLKVRAVLS